MLYKSGQLQTLTLCNQLLKLLLETIQMVTEIWRIEIAFTREYRLKVLQLRTHCCDNLPALNRIHFGVRITLLEKQPKWQYTCVISLGEKSF